MAGYSHLSRMRASSFEYNLFKSTIQINPCKFPNILHVDGTMNSPILNERAWALPKVETGFLINRRNPRRERIYFLLNFRDYLLHSWVHKRQ